MTIERKIEQYEDSFYAHGYIVSASPVEGEEEMFLNHLREGFAKVETVMAINAKRYGYRGPACVKIRYKIVISPPTRN